MIEENKPILKKIPGVEFLRHRRDELEIEDDKPYTRVTVQLHGRGILKRDEPYGREIRIKKQYVVRKDDLLVAEIDAKVGGFGIVPAPLDGAIVSSHYFPFEVDQSVCLPGFLDLLCRVGWFTSAVGEFVQGSLNYAAIRPRHVLELNFPIVEKGTQVRLIEAMRRIAHAREEAEGQIRELDAMAPALLRAAFSGAL